ncbi:MAG TPA: hypothetical protein VG013_43245 [Gemmataceae bacterium]|nr:hypothetical protein [Gemmataceae bacterium]
MLRPWGDTFGRHKNSASKARAEPLAGEGHPLSAREVGKLLGLPAQRVEEHRQAGRLLAVDPGNGGYVFPSWQFTKDGVLPGLQEVLADLRAFNAWAQLRFFVNDNFRLNGESALQALRKGKLDEVRKAARNYGEHGAV